MRPTPSLDINYTAMEHADGVIRVTRGHLDPASRRMVFETVSVTSIGQVPGGQPLDEAIAIAACQRLGWSIQECLPPQQD